MNAEKGESDWAGCLFSLSPPLYTHLCYSHVLNKQEKKAEKYPVVAGIRETIGDY